MLLDEVDEYIDPWADSSPAVIMSSDSNVISVPVSPTIIRSMESDVISVPVSPTVIQSTASNVVFVPVSPTSIPPSASHIIYVPVVSPTVRSAASNVISVSVSSTKHLPTASNVVFVPVPPTTLSTVSSIISVPLKDQLSPISSTNTRSPSSVLISTLAKDQSSWRGIASSTATRVSLSDQDKTNSARNEDKASVTGKIPIVQDKDETYTTRYSNSLTDSLVAVAPITDTLSSRLEGGKGDKTITVTTYNSPDLTTSEKDRATSTSDRTSSTLITHYLTTCVQDKDNDESISTALASSQISNAVITGSLVISVSNKDNFTWTASMSKKSSIAMTSSSVVTAVPDKDKDTDRDKDKYLSIASNPDKIGRAVITGSTRTFIPGNDKPNSTVSISDKVCIAVITSSTVIGILEKDKDKLTATVSTSDKISSAATSISSTNGVSDKYKSSSAAPSANYDKIGSASLFASLSSETDRSSSATSITRGDKTDTYTPSSPASQTVSEEHKPTSTPLINGKFDSSEAIPSLSIPGKDQIFSSPRILVPTQETNAVPAKDHSYFSSQTSSTKSPTNKDQLSSSFTDEAKISSPLQVASITTIPERDKFPNSSPAKHQISSSLVPGNLLSSSSSILNSIPEKNQVTVVKSKSVPAKDQATLASISVPAQYQSISSSVPANSLVSIKDASESIVGSAFVSLTSPTPTKDENIYIHSPKDEATFSIATATSMSYTETDTLIESSAEITPLLEVSSTNSETHYYTSMPEVTKQRIVSPPNYGLRSKSKAPFLNITSKVIPIWTPAMLGNAYGGGYITTPSVFVTSFPDSPRPSPGIPPGYELSSEDSQSSKYIPTLASADVQETTSVPGDSTPGVLLAKSDDKTSKLINSATTSVAVPVISVPIDQKTTDVPTVSTLSNYGPEGSLATSMGSESTPLSFTSKDKPNTPTIATLSAPGLSSDNFDQLVSLTQRSALKGEEEAGETSYPSSFEFPASSKVTLSTTTIPKDAKDNPTAYSVLPSAGGSISRQTGLYSSGKGGNNSVILALSPTAIPEFQGLALKHTIGSTIGLVCLSLLMFFL